MSPTSSTIATESAPADHAPSVGRSLASGAIDAPRADTLPARSSRGRAAAYVELARPRIVALVLLTMVVAAVAGAARLPTGWELFHGLLGACLVIVGSVTLNQRWEAASDALMPRTAGRPLPTGRLSRAEVATFGLVATVGGLAYLHFFSNHVLLLLTLASWVIYVCIYTPLKQFSAWQTPIGAVAGAMPALLGAALAGQAPTLTGWVLFGVVFFWQFPHAMAIAWLYRKQFAAAGVRVATVTDPTGRLAAAMALAGGMALVPVSLLPAALLPLEGLLVEGGYLVGASLLNVAYLAASVGWLRRRDDASARRLLRVSLLYLPALYLILLAAVWLG
jgi:protoheme IX farnesyltransferase